MDKHAIITTTITAKEAVAACKYLSNINQTKVAYRILKHCADCAQSDLKDSACTLDSIYADWGKKIAAAYNIITPSRPSFRNALKQLCKHHLLWKRPHVSFEDDAGVVDGKMRVAWKFEITPFGYAMMDDALANQVCNAAAALDCYSSYESTTVFAWTQWLDPIDRLAFMQ